MSVHDSLREAIQKKVVVGFTFNEKNYVGSPHALGKTDGVAHVLIYRGEDAHQKGVAPSGQWSCLPLTDISDLKLLPSEPFHVGHPDAHDIKGLHTVEIRVA